MGFSFLYYYAFMCTSREYHFSMLVMRYYDLSRLIEIHITLVIGLTSIALAFGS
jgi:hypothetical protein